MVDVLSIPNYLETEAPRQQRLAVFLGRATLPDIDALRVTAVKYAGLIGERTVAQSIKSPFLLGLEESLHELKAAIQSPDAELNIALPKTLVEYSRGAALLADYY